MSPSGSSDPHEGACFPRVSGDEPDSVSYQGCYHVFSPRERG